VIPIVTPSRMAEVDAAASESTTELVERAARAVARVAVRMLGGTYGRRVVVLVGPGNNGADGRVAAGHLRRRGVRCRVVHVGDAPPVLPASDLVIDAAFGTGLSRPYFAPGIVAGTPVLAVDIPSGIDGLTAQRLGEPLRAERTVTFVALKPGMVLEPGRSFTGVVEVADIGLDPGPVDTHAVVDSDVAELLHDRPADDHKWRSGVRVIGGSRGMTGAASLAARAAQRSGAGIVQLAMPGARGDEGPIEAVGHPLPAEDWAEAAFAPLDGRIRAVLIGPGLGSLESDASALAAAIECPLVIDGDALQLSIVARLGVRSASTVLTPHDGEWKRIGGSGEADRLAATRAFAVAHQVTVVRKGPTTVVAAADGRVRVITSGSPALASAGTGDVLAGCIVALLARGHDGFAAATVAAHIHGTAGTALGAGLVASEVADRLAVEFAALRDAHP
jgi:ADP-dependent NAD(P)H-hydrate dehydratase / NAD(P)H-hydrate epimerase